MKFFILLLWEIENIFKTLIVFVGLGAQIMYWALGLSRERGSPRTNEWLWMVQTQCLISKMLLGRCSEEEYLLGQAEHRSDKDLNDQSDLWGSSSDKDMYHKRTNMMRIQKNLRESCYHRIKCNATTFLAAFMWRRPLNSTALATTNHRKPGGVSDGTSTQVKVQMIDKCKIKMARRELYNVRNLPWGRDRKNRERIL